MPFGLASALFHACSNTFLLSSLVYRVVKSWILLPASLNMLTKSPKDASGPIDVISCVK